MPDREITFMLATTAFSYYTHIRDPFIKESFSAVFRMREASRFPETAIIDICREELSGYARSRMIPVCDDDETKADIVHDNKALFLSIVQDIPFHLGKNKLDWDHLYARDNKRYMKKINAETGDRRSDHKNARLVNSVGNYAGVPAKINREVQAKMPKSKFEHYQDVLKRRESEWFWGKGKSLQERLFLSDEEMQLLLDASQMLKPRPDTNAKLNRAMEMFEQYIDKREKRIWDEVERRYRLTAYKNWREL